ncbi:hypothetical protein F2Q70_00034161 [Brassica cretica]|uniref:Protein kinase domain-containing protein n=1 Tax=Brassica cretica TaxID=69181 RepID=A0A8S9K2I9_BRACR|nr:hypothetical protein F2Q70_00034161 [Brassica cretica]
MRKYLMSRVDIALCLVNHTASSWFLHGLGLGTVYGPSEPQQNSEKSSQDSKVYRKLASEAVQRDSTATSSVLSERALPREEDQRKLHFVRNDQEKFTLQDMLRASAEVLGSGGFGSSYKAALTGSRAVVVKRFRFMNNIRREEFYDHMKKIGRLSHPNLLPLIAFYYRKDEKLLVTNYIPNGSLANLLHANRTPGQVVLDWPIRLKIARGVTRGLAYLYRTFPDLNLPHGHLKSSNVLLNHDFEPLLTDYALVPVVNKEQSHQFMVAYKSPEFTQQDRTSRKSDVWSLGILILEILTGKFPANYLRQGKGADDELAAWVESVARTEWNADVFDKEMRAGKEQEGQMLKLLKIGLRCCDWDVERRMELHEAVDRIEEVDHREAGGSQESFRSSYVTASDGENRFSRAMTGEFSLVRRQRKAPDHDRGHIPSLGLGTVYGPSEPQQNSEKSSQDSKVYRKLASEAVQRDSTATSSVLSERALPREEDQRKLHFVRNDQEKFTLQDMLRASAEVLGSGGFGSSYKAALTGSRAVVVKRFRFMNNIRREEFYDHMKKIGRLSHPNLLPLIAFYYRKDEKLLVTNYIPNGSLANLLHANRTPGQVVLDWPIRLKIARGVTRGLAYLYRTFPDLNLPHGHLKSSNVLLDHDFEPLLTDHALVPVVNKEQSHQFMVAYKSPEFTQQDRTSRKSDVWSLGILILEILTGKFPANYLRQGKGADDELAAWVESVARTEWNADVFDKEMRAGKEQEGQMLKLLKIGLRCCDWDVERRMELHEAVDRIEEVDHREAGGSQESFRSSYVTASDGENRFSRAMTGEFSLV